MVKAITEIFRDQQVLRESRDRARLKYLFMKEGWTAQSFLAELQSRLDFTLAAGVDEDVPDETLRDHVGIHRQRQTGLSYVGASVLRGRLTRRTTGSRSRPGGQVWQRRFARNCFAEPAFH